MIVDLSNFYNYNFIYYRYVILFIFYIYSCDVFILAVNMYGKDIALYFVLIF